MFKKNISKVVVRFITAILIYGAFLYIYKNEISLSNAYLGFCYKTLSLWEYAISVGFYLIPLIWLPKSPQKPSDITIWLLYIFSYAPTTFMCFHIIDNPFPDAIFFLLSMLIALIITDLFRRHQIYLNAGLNGSLEKLMDKFIIILSALICVYVLSLSGFELHTDFSSIYERRLTVREYSSWWSSYILSFCRSVVTIILLYLVLVKRNMISLLILVVCSIGIFSYDGTKTSLLIPIFLATIYYLVIHYRSFNVLFILMLSLIITSIIEFNLFDYNTISNLFIRRAFAGTGFLNTAFWEYYSIHDKVLMTDSIGRFFVDSSNVTAAPYVIGYKYFSNPDINANTGIWMGAYAHFGLFGIIMISSIAGIILGLIDNLTKERFLILGFLVCSYMGILWVEQMLHTSIITGGVIYIIIFLVLYCNSNLLRRRRSFSTNVIRG